MKFLIVGLGSMGKRRIRCLKALGHGNVAGYDPRPDRREEAVAKYGVAVYGDFDQALCSFAPTALIISVPPDLHHHYMEIALERGIHFFVEASVVDTRMDLIKQKAAQSATVAAPSATLLYHPAIRLIGDLVRSGKLGRISNVMHHSGQYLPDWHTYEPVSAYYVSNPATGGGREIVPFELAWLTSIFGFPKRVCGNFRKTIQIEGAEGIDDTYNMLLDYGEFLATVTVDVVSRHATRRLLVNGELAQLVWDWDEACVRVFDPKKGDWETLPYSMGEAAPGYNANIGENMYIDEIQNFIDAMNGVRPFANTLETDHTVLKLLYAVEKSDQTSSFVGFLS
ncbi:Gfo/Idh/MocA family oxidoreductase [Geomonas nitrogeniifigens]|uniref:Gfo/Idh/MocA family oxidoreductase n=1 Tax=Geomonas diazotrophica TaxID=2843197 RepID=A0ABX8JFQ4_9BACT|nr:Gfo/Idh/MocA family oxidoreductase [Geomonas nitrogeniifigens]QWV95971.1 Gfo/Idh/MocA family oxidoreductase [Geomonas nitrogeniifigens]